ncbi:MAG: twin-arginine translocase subunit TatC [Flavobacteriaceae bacterium]
MAKRKNLSAEKEMSFLDHLEELRWHLIRSTLAIVILSTIAFLAKDFIFDVLIFGPKHADFPTYQILCQMAQAIGVKESFCFTELPFRIQSRTMGGQFSAHIWTSITAGFIVAFPYILHEMWKFISPGLKMKERSSARGFIFIASILFFIGVLFGYYVVTPLSINFLGTYQVSGEVHNDFDLSSYISLVRASVVASGLIFELPILIYILTKLGVVTPQILKKYRKFSLVFVLILSAIITPPDIASQIIVSVPILILYEISIFISKAVIRKQEKLLKKEAKKSDLKD